MLLEILSVSIGGKPRKSRVYASLLETTYMFDLIAWAPERFNKFKQVCFVYLYFDVVNYKLLFSIVDTTNIID